MLHFSLQVKGQNGNTCWKHLGMGQGVDLQNERGAEMNYAVYLPPLAVGPIQPLVRTNRNTSQFKINCRDEVTHQEPISVLYL